MAAISWVPSAAYQTEALDVLNNPGQKHGNYASVPVNPVSQNLVNALWPASALSQPAGPDTYVNSDPEYGYSYNWLIKLDHRIDQSNNLSFRWFAGQGNQVSPVGTTWISAEDADPCVQRPFACRLLIVHVEADQFGDDRDPNYADQSNGA